MLSVINNELGADFDPDAFDHVALWNEDERWIEMRLRSTRGPDGPGRGARHSTSSSAPARTSSPRSAPSSIAEGLEPELGEAGFVVDAMWGKTEGEFVLALAQPNR